MHASSKACGSGSGRFANHIILRGNNRRNLFSDGSDRAQFLWYLQRAARKTSCEFNALSLVTNHVHIVANPSTVEALSECMRVTSQKYAVYRNKKRGGTGKLFESRFWSKPVTDETYLAVLTAYVDLNPEEAGVAKRYLHWTTLAHHLNEPGRSRIPSDLWTPSQWYIGLGETSQARAEQYRVWVDDFRCRHDELTRLHDVPTVSRSYPLRLERPNRTSAK